MAHLGRFFIATIVVLVTTSLSAATITVDLRGGADYTEIQPAIDAAADGDTVLVKLGEYVITEPINFNRLHDPDDPASPPVKNIVVKSEGGVEATKIRMAETPANPETASVMIFTKNETTSPIPDEVRITGGMGFSDFFKFKINVRVSSIAFATKGPLLLKYLTMQTGNMVSSWPSKMMCCGRGVSGKCLQDWPIGRSD